MVGILVSYWGGLFSGAMSVSGRVIFFKWVETTNQKRWFPWCETPRILRTREWQPADGVVWDSPKHGHFAGEWHPGGSPIPRYYLYIYIYMIMYHIFFYISGQIITTSAEVTLNGGLIRELPQNPLNSGLGIILICPDIYIYISFQSFMMEAEHATRKNRGDDPNLDMIIFRFHVKSVGSVFDIL